MNLLRPGLLSAPTGATHMNALRTTAKARSVTARIFGPPAVQIPFRATKNCGYGIEQAFWQCLLICRAGKDCTVALKTRQENEHEHACQPLCVAKGLVHRVGRSGLLRCFRWPGSMSQKKENQSVMFTQLKSVSYEGKDKL